MVESLPFAPWESFYVIVGSSAAALTGLNFVVIALSGEGHTPEPTEAAINAFTTPTIVHFGVVLFIAALVAAPWREVLYPHVGFVAAGLFGLIYQLVVVRRALRQHDYKPVMEDWIWHFTIPLVAYPLLVVSGMLLAHHVELAMFLIAAASLVLLYVGIHNAWDSVTWMVSAQARKKARKD